MIYLHIDHASKPLPHISDVVDKNGVRLPPLLVCTHFHFLPRRPRRHSITEISTATGLLQRTAQEAFTVYFHVSELVAKRPAVQRLGFCQTQ